MDYILKFKTVTGDPFGCCLRSRCNYVLFLPYVYFHELCYIDTRFLTLYLDTTIYSGAESFMIHPNHFFWLLHWVYRVWLKMELGSKVKKQASKDMKNNLKLCSNLCKNIFFYLTFCKQFQIKKPNVTMYYTYFIASYI